MRGEPHGAGQREGAPGVNPLERLRSSGLSDEQLDAHINGNRIPGTSSAPGVYSEQDVSEEDQPAPLTTAAGTAGETPGGERGEGGRRRRRRRRRRRGDGQVTEGPATQEAAAGDSAAVAEAMEDNPSDLPESLIDSEAEMDDSAELPSEDPEAVENDGASSSIEAADEGEPLPAAPVKRAARSRAKAAKKAPTTKKASKRTTSSGTRAKVTSSRSRSPGKKTSD